MMVGGVEGWGALKQKILKTPWAQDATCLELHLVAVVISGGDEGSGSRGGRPEWKKKASYMSEGTSY